MPPPVDAERPDKHQSGNDQQTCSREIAEVISGKTGCPGGDAVEKKRRAN